MPSLFFINNKHREPADQYQVSLLAAVIRTSGGEVVEVTGSLKPTQRHGDRWLRDMVTLLPDRKQVLLSSKGCSTRAAMQRSLMAHLQTIDPTYRMLEVDVYFEGGHLFYLPGQNILLHGNNLGGHYYQSTGHYLEYPPIEQTQKLAERLAVEDIRVIGIELSDIVKTQLHDNTTLGDFVYHLDCFMQLMPNGRMLILNSAILSAESLAQLHEILGDRLIDLGYEDYLTTPTLLNFITVPYQNEVRIISHSLPQAVCDRLASLGYTQLITNQTLLPSSNGYHAEFAQATCRAMKGMGYTKKLDNHSLLCNPQQENSGASVLSTLLGEDAFESLNPGYSGGIHCLTLEVPDGAPTAIFTYEGNLQDTAPAFYLPEHAETLIQLFMKGLDEVDAQHCLWLSLKMHHNPLVRNQLLQYLLDRALSCHPQRGYSNGFEIDFMNNLKKCLPDLRKTIDCFITQHKAYFFLSHSSELPLHTSIQDISLQEALPVMTSFEHVYRVYQHFIGDMGIACEAYFLLQQHVEQHMQDLIENEYDQQCLAELFPTLTQAIEQSTTSSEYVTTDSSSSQELSFWRCITKFKSLVAASEPVAIMQHALQGVTIENYQDITWFVREKSPMGSPMDWAMGSIGLSVNTKAGQTSVNQAFGNTSFISGRQSINLNTL